MSLLAVQQAQPPGFVVPLGLLTGNTGGGFGLVAGNPAFSASFWLRRVGTGCSGLIIGFDDLAGSTACATVFTSSGVGSLPTKVASYSAGSNGSSMGTVSALSATAWSHILISYVPEANPANANGPTMLTFSNGRAANPVSLNAGGAWTPNASAEVFDSFVILGGADQFSGLSPNPSAANNIKIAEVAVWVGNPMGLQDARALYAGCSPLRVAQGSLLTYAPLRDSPLTYGPYRPALQQIQFNTTTFAPQPGPFTPQWSDHPVVDPMPRRRLKSTSVITPASPEWFYVNMM